MSIVSFSGYGEATFRGFLIQARPVNNDTLRVGEFVPLNPNEVLVQQSMCAIPTVSQHYTQLKYRSIL